MAEILVVPLYLLWRLETRMPSSNVAGHTAHPISTPSQAASRAHDSQAKAKSLPCPAFLSIFTTPHTTAVSRDHKPVRRATIYPPERRHKAQECSESACTATRAVWADRWANSRVIPSIHGPVHLDRRAFRSVSTQQPRIPGLYHRRLVPPRSHRPRPAQWPARICRYQHSSRSGSTATAATT